MEKEDFYQQCADILGAEHIWTEPGVVRTRWTNRYCTGGNGRFPGFGLIRWNASDLIQVTLRYPTTVNQWCKSPEEVLELLRGLQK